MTLDRTSHGAPDAHHTDHHLPENSAASRDRFSEDLHEDPLGDVRRCAAPLCRMPRVGLLCFGHTRRGVLATRRIEAGWRGLPDDRPLAIGEFAHPAAGWPLPWVMLRCSVCSAAWVDKYATWPWCEWCLRREGSEVADA
jgi:hypothetical protein